jgi:hypothetical protein
MKVYGRVYLEIHVFLSSALVEGQWSASRPGRFTHRRKSPRYELDKMLGGPHEPAIMKCKITKFSLYLQWLWTDQQKTNINEALTLIVRVWHAHHHSPSGPVASVAKGDSRSSQTTIDSQINHKYCHQPSAKYVF